MIDHKLEAQVDAYVKEIWEDAIADIGQLVAHPSVSDVSAAEQGAPFGRPVREALDAALRIARRLGYETSDDDGYIGIADIADIAGQRSAHIATIAHIDVVPAGPGWRTDPFALERRDGWLLGRGALDDKGPAVLSLYAGAFLRRQGGAPRYGFRALLGCDEEAGMRDVDHYLDSHENPAFLFTPDAAFPVCNAEKGNYNAEFKSAPISSGRILFWSGAAAGNAIPGESIIELAVDAEKLPAPREHVDRIGIEPVRQGVSRIVARGIGGHASLPEDTMNAIGIIVGYLRASHVIDGEEARFLELLSKVLADTSGAQLGIASENEAFGALTLNGGTIEVRDGRIVQSIDIRYPDSTSAAAITERLSALAADFGAEFRVASSKPPFSVDADDPAVRALIDVYGDVTGTRAEPFSMGGGTYARKFARAVSFGPEEEDLVAPEWIGSMHGPDEGASERSLRRALKIYILAILRLQELEL